MKLRWSIWLLLVLTLLQVNGAPKRPKRRDVRIDLDEQDLKAINNNNGDAPVNAIGMKCEDSPLVEATGISCRLLARNIGPLGCQRIIQELANEQGRSLDGIPPIFKSRRIADACPASCGLCVACAPGCMRWFIANGFCEPACNNAYCQFDGGDCWQRDCEVGPWGSFGECSVNCGEGGYRTRRREIIKKPQMGGKPCPPLEEKEYGCNADVLCSVDCVHSPWSEWSECSAPCGTGKITRYRAIVTHPENGGEPCGPLEQSIDCFEKPCSIDCQVSDWSEWSQCDKKCGGGMSFRTRHVIQEPSYGGKECPELYEEQVCNFKPCSELAECKLSDWSPWSSCDKPCGKGLMTRERTVISGNCIEHDLKETVVCNSHDCMNKCEVSDWSAWSECSGDCGLGVQERHRVIISKEPYDSQTCPPLTEQRACYGYLCNFNCMSSDWSSCTTANDESCGVGFEWRIARNKKATSNDCLAKLEIRDCFLPCNNDDEQCFYNSCNDWTYIDDVNDKHCLKITNRRTCSNKEIRDKCPDVDQVLTGLSDRCLNSCIFSDWEHLKECKGTCKAAYTSKTRKLIGLPKGNTRCGHLEEKQLCAKHNCKDEIILSDWNDFGECIGKCGQEGIRTRTRSMLFCPPHTDCTDVTLVETEKCDKVCYDPEILAGQCIYDQWSDWSECTRVNERETVSIRIREILSGDEEYCTQKSQIKPCFLPPEPKQCIVSEWSSWSACTVFCGGGKRWRTRSILRQPINSDEACGHLIEEEDCNIFECNSSKNCVLSLWSEWSECSKPCGGGIKTRERRVVTPALPGGTCGDLFAKKGCNLSRCPGEKCQDHQRIKESPVNCAMLKTQGCTTNLVKLARENGVEDQLPPDVPPEARVQDVCPETCGVCTVCAPGCELRDLGNSVCNPECNNEDCEFDHGDCSGDCRFLDAEVPNSMTFNSKSTAIYIGETVDAVCPKNQRLKHNQLLYGITLVCTDDKTFTLVDNNTPRQFSIRMPELERIECATDFCPFIEITAVGNFQDTLFYVFTGQYERQNETNGELTYVKNTGFNTIKIQSLNNHLFIYDENVAIYFTELLEIDEFSNGTFEYREHDYFRLQDTEDMSVLELFGNIDDAEAVLAGRLKIKCQTSRSTEPTSNIKDVKTKFKVANSKSGMPMACENLSMIEKIAKVSCEQMVASLGCSYRLENTGQAPGYLNPDATVATVCPQSCGACHNVCSSNCPDWFLGNGTCDDSCNNEQCAYDLGDCNFNDDITFLSATSHQQSNSYTSKDMIANAKPDRRYYDECIDFILEDHFDVNCPTLSNHGVCGQLISDSLSMPPDIQTYDIRVHDVCPESCNSCSELRYGYNELSSILNVNSIEPITTEQSHEECQDNYLVKQLSGLECRQAVPLLNFNCRIQIKNFDKPTDLAPNTTVDELCPHSCGVCYNPNLRDPFCEDLSFIEDVSGFTCDQVIEMLGEDSCDKLISDFGQELPAAIPDNLKLKNICPVTCGICKHGDPLSLPFKRTIETTHQQTVVKSTSINNFNDVLNIDCFSVITKQQDCSRLLLEFSQDDPELDARIQELHNKNYSISPVTVLAAVCNQQCGFNFLPADSGPLECVDSDDLVKAQMLSRCSSLIDYFGCATQLNPLLNDYNILPNVETLLTSETSYTFVNALNKALGPTNIESATIGTICSSSCKRCIPKIDPNINHDCADDPRLKEVGITCAHLLSESRLGCNDYISQAIFENSTFTDTTKLGDNKIKLNEICRQSCNNCFNNEVQVKTAPKVETVCQDSSALAEQNISCKQLLLMLDGMTFPRACEEPIGTITKGTKFESLAPTGITIKTLCSKTCHQCKNANTCDDGFRNGEEEWIDCGGPDCSPCEPCLISSLKYKLAEQDPLLTFSDINLPQTVPNGTKVPFQCSLDYKYSHSNQVAICRSGVWNLQKGQCLEPVDKLLSFEFTINNFETNSIAFINSVNSAIRTLFAEASILDLGELYLFKTGTCKAFQRLLSSPAFCQDDQEVAKQGITCSLLMSMGCNMNIYELAAKAGQPINSNLPKDAKVSDACPKSCDTCFEAAVRRSVFEAIKTGKVISEYCQKFKYLFIPHKDSDELMSDDTLVKIRSELNYYLKAAYEYSISNFAQLLIDKALYTLKNRALRDVTIKEDLVMVYNELSQPIAKKIIELKQDHVADVYFNQIEDSIFDITELTVSNLVDVKNYNLLLKKKQENFSALIVHNNIIPTIDCNSNILALFSRSPQSINLLAQAITESENTLIGSNENILNTAERLKYIKQAFQVAVNYALTNYKFLNDYEINIDKNAIINIAFCDRNSICCKINEKLIEYLTSDCILNFIINEDNSDNLFVFCSEINSNVDKKSNQCLMTLRILLEQMETYSCFIKKPFSQFLQSLCYKVNMNLCLFELVNNFKQVQTYEIHQLLKHKDLTCDRSTCYPHNLDYANSVSVLSLGLSIWKTINSPDQFMYLLNHLKHRVVINQNYSYSTLQNAFKSNLNNKTDLVCSLDNNEACTNALKLFILNNFSTYLLLKTYLSLSDCFKKTGLLISSILRNAGINYESVSLLVKSTELKVFMQHFNDITPECYQISPTPRIEEENEFLVTSLLRNVCFDAIKESCNVNVFDNNCVSDINKCRKINEVCFKESLMLLSAIMLDLEKLPSQTFNIILQNNEQYSTLFEYPNILPFHLNDYKQEESKIINLTVYVSKYKSLTAPSGTQSMNNLVPDNQVSTVPVLNSITRDVINIINQDKQTLRSLRTINSNNAPTVSPLLHRLVDEFLRTSRLGISSDSLINVSVYQLNDNELALSFQYLVNNGVDDTTLLKELGAIEFNNELISDIIAKNLHNINKISSYAKNLSYNELNSFTNVDDVYVMSSTKKDLYNTQCSTVSLTEILENRATAKFSRQDANKLFLNHNTKVYIECNYPTEHISYNGNENKNEFLAKLNRYNNSSNQLFATCQSHSWIFSQNILCEARCSTTSLHKILYERQLSTAQALPQNIKLVQFLNPSCQKIQHLINNEYIGSDVRSRSALLVNCVNKTHPNITNNNFGSSLIYCLDGKWIIDEIQCGPSCDTMPSWYEENKNAYIVKGTMSYNGATRIVSCNANYNAHPPQYEGNSFTITCDSDATWTKPLFSCTKGFMIDPGDRSGFITLIAGAVINKTSVILIVIFAIATIIFSVIVSIIWKKKHKYTSDIEYEQRRRQTSKFLSEVSNIKPTSDEN